MTSTPTPFHEMSSIGLADETKKWATVIQRARKGIGRITVSKYEHLDIIEKVVGHGTGFYADEEHGFVITNKHIVGPNPAVASIVFEGSIELEVSVVYVDPELDFAIARVNAKFARSRGIKAIPLAAEKAQPGIAIRLLGHDDEHGLSIGQATISRVDMKPYYAHETYGMKILNCEYMQAAFSTVGGSSGSPAVDIEGQAVGLMMGTTDHTSTLNYLLPLYYPQLVIEKLAAGITTPRGTIQAKWNLQPLHESERFGLPDEWDNKIRAQGRTNAIVAEAVLEAGPAHNKIKEGDILLEVDQELQTDLRRLSMYQDSRVGREVSFRVWRQDREIQVDCYIGDLHAISPHHLISCFGATFHSVGWMTACWANHPLGGIYVAGEPTSEAFKPHHLLVSINNHPTPDMESLLRVLQGLLQTLGQGGQYISTIHTQIIDRKTVRTTAYLPSMYFDSPLEMRRDPLEGGGWVENKISTTPSAASNQCLIQVGSGMCRNAAQGIKTALPENLFDKKVNEIFHGIVSLHISRSVQVDGYKPGDVIKTGLLLAHGLVVTHRGSTSYFDQIKITLPVGTEVRAHVIFMHEAADLTLVEYNPAELPHSPELKPICLSERRLKEGDDVYFFKNSEQRNVVRTCVELLSHRTYGGDDSFYMPFHHETVLLTSSLSKRESGVITYGDGKVAGLQKVWLDHDDGQNYYLPASRIADVFELWKSDQLGNIRFQDFDVKSVSHADAFWESLPDHTVSALAAQYSHDQQLVVDRVPLHCTSLSGKDELHPLREGDVILELDKKRLTQSSDLRYIFMDDLIPVRVLRDRKVVDCLVPTIPIDCTQIKEFVYVGGITFHKPSLRAKLSRTCHSEVFAAANRICSPGHVYNFPTQTFIDRINGKEIATMEDFKSAITVPDKKYFTLRTLYFYTEQTVVLKKSEDHFPSFIYTTDGRSVTRTAVRCVENVDDEDANQE